MRTQLPFTGSLVPVVTPFRDGAVDYESLGNLIERLIDQGSHGIVSCGTTGESSTLSTEEHVQVIAFTVGTVSTRVPVIAGTGSNSTEETILLTRAAMDAGADGSLLVTPYYVKPTQEGLFRHYMAAAEALEDRFPIILYNVPGRTGVNMEPATVARLEKAARSIVGIKEASGSMAQMSDIIRLCGDDFSVYSGDDFTTLTAYALGARGTISVTANILPGKVADLWDAWNAGDLDAARDLHYMLERLNKAMFIESNPIPVKTALAAMGWINEEFRLPLCPMGEENRNRLLAVLTDYTLLG